MGSRQEAETSLGNQSNRLLPHPAVAGLSRFQQTIQGFTASALILACAPELLPHPAFAQTLSQSTETTVLVAGESLAVDSLTLELSQRVTQEVVLPLAEKGIDIDLTGELLTNAWVDPITGDRMLGLRNMVFRFGMDGRPKLIPNQLDKINLQDPRISMADPIPPRSQDPIIVDPDVEEHVATLGKVLGIEDPQVTGILTTPSFEVFRLNDDLIFLRPSEGPNTGQFILGNAGWQTILTGGIDLPVTAMLSPEQSATGGGTPAPVEALTRPFLPEYKITWPDGKSFTVINPENGNKGFIINPDKEVQLPVRDPNTFIPLRDTEGNLIMRSGTVKDELKTAMDTYKVPKIIFVPSVVLGLERPNGYLATGYGTPEQRPYLYFEVIAKPDAFPDALVYVYTFSETVLSLDNSAENALFAGIGQFLGSGIYEFASASPNTIIRPKEGTPTDLGLIMYTLRTIRPVEHVYS